MPVIVFKYFIKPRYGQDHLNLQTRNYSKRLSLLGAEEQINTEENRINCFHLEVF